MNGDQAFYYIALLLGFLLLLWGKRLFFLFPSFIGALWFVALQDQIIGERQPRFYLVSFVVAFSTILVAYFVFKKVILRVAVFFSGLYLGFVAGALFGVENILIELGIGVVLGIVLLALFVKIFDLALVLVSAAIGSVVLFMASKEFWNVPDLIVPVLFVMGSSFQIFVLHDGRRKSDSDDKEDDDD